MVPLLLPMAVATTDLLPLQPSDEGKKLHSQGAGNLWMSECDASELETSLVSGLQPVAGFQHAGLHRKFQTPHKTII